MVERNLAIGFAVVFAALVVSSASFVSWVRRVERELETVASERDALARRSSGRAAHGLAAQEAPAELRRELSALRSLAQRAVQASREAAAQPAGPAGDAGGGERPAIGDAPRASAHVSMRAGGGRIVPGGPAPAARGGAAGAAAEAVAADGEGGEARSGADGRAGASDGDSPSEGALLALFRENIVVTHRGRLAKYTRTLGLSLGQQDGVWGALEARADELTDLESQRKRLAPEVIDARSRAIDGRMQERIRLALTAEQALAFDRFERGENPAVAASGNRGR